ncbi:MAG TPA: hypothetical protein VM934_16390 [Pyrinomonadaceae bacterium]|jgi:hypothetical protein|nr:hypothetical protein [Pyrinomonadaceae bacterium]
MKKFALLLLFALVVSAHAQEETSMSEGDPGFVIMGMTNTGGNPSDEDSLAPGRMTMTIKNTGARTIKSIEWDIVFVRSLDKGQSRWYRVESKGSVAPGKTKTLSAALPGRWRCVEFYAPADASETRPALRYGKGKCIGVRAQVGDLERTDFLIRRVEYADGTAWVSPQAD